jgi:DNA-binding Lrp family transcriptional regulator
MPIRAYVLVSTDPGKAKDVADKVSNISGSPRVKRSCAIMGRFDVLAEVEADDLDSLTNTVLSKIATIPGVRRTETAVVSWEKTL